MYKDVTVYHALCSLTSFFRASLCNLVLRFQAKNANFSRFWVLLHDRYGFYAWDLCGFVGLFAMPDNYPFRHNAAFPQIFAFFMILGQFQQKLVWFP